MFLTLKNSYNSIFLTLKSSYDSIFSVGAGLGDFSGKQPLKHFPKGRQTEVTEPKLKRGFRKSAGTGLKHDRSKNTPLQEPPEARPRKGSGFCFGTRAAQDLSGNEASDGLLTFPAGSHLVIPDPA